MMEINFSKLKGILHDKNSKSKQVKNSQGGLLDFTALIGNFIEFVHNLTEDELAFIVISLQNWLTRKEDTKYHDKNRNNKIKVGDIFFADLGIGYKPEIAYTHPVIVIEIVKNYVLVVPITSSADTVKCAYHPIENPNGDKKYRKIKKSDGLGMDCAAILTNVTTISQGRLINRKGKLNNINNEASIFNEIKMKCFYYCFPKQYKEYTNLKLEKEWTNIPNDIY